ncbi:MAG: hypothetical protein K6G55_01905 [Selenomonadaceae bacterium]|nr:hypothetical protein [Selenomonadaceae bacterium]
MLRKIFSAVMVLALIVITSNVSAAEPRIGFAGYVQDIGWMNPVRNGGMIGTVGRNKRLEAFVINSDGDIRYNAHVQNIGWQGWMHSGEVAGTANESLRIEAVMIDLGRRLSRHYDIYYRAHVQDIGWLGWARNGEPAGTSGASLRLEALQIQLVPKGTAFDHNPGEAYYQR